MPALQLLRKPKTPIFLLIGLIALYAIYFSWYTINRHDTLNSYAADLSLIDQPMWNTVLGPGGFMEQTWGDRQQPRLAEHFEPILIPLALLFFIWDNVRILLIAQSVALALGALPVFWIARKQFARIKYFADDRTDEQLSLPHWAALAFATVYLLYPHLQAANIADFHADPFVVTPLLLAFWYASEKRWGWMWLWAFVAMTTKETLPTLTAMLGVWLLIKTYRQTKPTADETARHRTALISHIATRQGVALIALSTVWFLVTTFLIVAPLAEQYFGTEGPIYFANRYGGDWGEMLQDPARWRYLLGLLAAVGFLPLLAPELLILGLPLLLANFFSSFPGQYSGEQHYSAPLVVAFIIAAIYGTRRWTERTSLREINGQTLRMASLIGITLWILAWSLSYHALHGWTPLSIRTESYVTTPAARQVTTLIDQIPAEAVVSASAAIHPHLAHRRVVYVFPTVEEADYLLVDVTDIPGVHPNDAKAKLLALLEDDWELLTATNGLILAHRRDNQAKKSVRFPDDFFDFARATGPPNQFTQLTFGDGRLQLIGYEVNDDPDDGVIFRLYWRTSAPLRNDLSLWPLIYDDTGQLLSDPTQIPLIATVWYPPNRWQPGETIVTETLPQLMPDTFHLGIAVGPQGSFDDPAQRYPVQKPKDAKSSTLIIEPVINRPSRLNPGNWAQLASFKRQGPFLDRLPATPRLQALTPINVELGSTIHLTGFWLDENILEPGTTLPLILRWVADKPPATDLTVFVHLLAPDGTLVAQSDGYPTWLSPTPTSQWSPNQPILDRHLLSLPNDLATGLYTLRLGLYHAQTLERLPLSDGNDAISLSQIRIE